MNKEQAKEFRDFYWEVGKYEKRELGIDEYITFIDKLLKEEREEIQGDINSVIGMLNGTTDRKQIKNYIVDYLKNKNCG